jgi:hypothetical protein
LYQKQVFGPLSGRISAKNKQLIPQIQISPKMSNEVRRIVLVITVFTIRSFVQSKDTKDQSAKVDGDVAVVDGTTSISASLVTIKYGTSLKDAEKIIEAALKEKREIVGVKELNVKGSSFVKISVSAVNNQSYDEMCMELQQLELAEEEARADAQFKKLVSRFKNKEITAEELSKLRVAQVDEHLDVVAKITDVGFERVKAAVYSK